MIEVDSLEDTTFTSWAKVGQGPPSEEVTTLTGKLKLFHVPHFSLPYHFGKGTL
jgi:hypothetical protein